MSQQPSPSPRSLLVTLVGWLVFLEGATILAGAVLFVLAGAGFLSLLDGAAREAESVVAGGMKAGKLSGNVSDLAMAVVAVVAGCVFAVGLIPYYGGLAVLRRRGRVLAILWGCLSALPGLLHLAGGGPGKMLLLDGCGLASGLFTVYVLARAGDEFPQRPRRRRSGGPPSPRPPL